MEVIQKQIEKDLGIDLSAERGNWDEKTNKQFTAWLRVQQAEHMDPKMDKEGSDGWFGPNTKAGLKGHIPDEVHNAISALHDDGRLAKIHWRNEYHEAGFVIEPRLGPSFIPAAVGKDEPWDDPIKLPPKPPESPPEPAAVKEIPDNVLERLEGEIWYRYGRDIGNLEHEVKPEILDKDEWRVVNVDGQAYRARFNENDQVEAEYLGHHPSTEILPDGRVMTSYGPEQGTHKFDPNGHTHYFSKDCLDAAAPQMPQARDGLSGEFDQGGVLRGAEGRDVQRPKESVNEFQPDKLNL